MKKKMKKLMAALCMVYIMAFMTGCGDKTPATGEAYKPAVCFVIGRTANAQTPNFSSPLIQDTVIDCAENYGFVGVVNADGNSRLVAAESLDIDEAYKKASKERLKMDARSKANNIMIFLQNVVADDPDVDYLEAIRLASRTLAGLEGYTSKTIVVLGTGLSNSGYMNFCNNLLLAEAGNVAEELAAKELIPDLTSVDCIYWQGMGDTAAPQPDLSPAQKNNLTGIWNEVIKIGGSELKNNSFISNPVDTGITFPDMRVVNVPEETPVKFDESMLRRDAFKEPLILGEDQVKFVGDQSVYLEPEKAMRTLKPIGEFLVAHPEMKILLIGSTAGDVNDSKTYSLSEERAEAVKETLVSLGVDSNRIFTKGMGSSDPWHIPNAGYEGSLASQNRKVVVLDADTELAKSLM